MLKSKTRLLALFTGIFIAAEAIVSKADSSAWVPVPGRVQASAAQSNFTTLGADGMLPLLGDNHQFVYGDLAGDYSTDDTYLISPGLGYRTIANNQIWGGYLFDDYERTSLGENFWVLSPGVEWMNASWDAHINGYFPIQSRQQNGTTDWADNYGVYQYGDPYGNSYDDAYLTPYAVIGNGVDTEVGYSFDQGDHLRSRVFLGGYYYHPQDAYDVKNIGGATAGFTKAVTKNFTVSLLNSYDNINRYTFGINLAVTLGGDSNEYSGNVEDRMLDPVERHVGIIDTGAGTYDQQSYQVTGFGTEHDNNVGYVSTTARPDGVGTYEDPAPLTQESLDAFNRQFSDGALIYVQGGDSYTYNVNGTTAGKNDGLLLYDGQDVYGRSTDYKAPAASDEQPIILVDGNSVANGFIINSGENTLEDLTITASSTTGNTVGIDVVNNNTNTTINMTNININGFNTGLYGENDTTGNLIINTNNAQFNNNTSDGNAAEAYGMRVVNKSAGDIIINAINSKFNNNSVSGTGSNRAAGFYGLNTGAGDLILNATNSQFNQNNATSSDAVEVDAFGVEVVNTNSGNITVNANNSSFNENTVTANGATSAVGFYALNSGLGNLTLNASVSQFNNNSTQGDNAQAFGVLAVNSNAGNMSVDVVDSTFNNNTATGSDNYAFGISAYNTSTGIFSIEATQSQFDDNTGSGLYVSNASAGTLSVASLADSSFDSNRDYGIYGVGTTGQTELTYIDYADAVFSNNTSNIGSNGYVDFVS